MVDNMMTPLDNHLLEQEMVVLVVVDEVELDSMPLVLVDLEPQLQDLMDLVVVEALEEETKMVLEVVVVL